MLWVKRYIAFLNIEGGSALSSCQAAISVTLYALFCDANCGSHSAYRPRCGSNSGHAFWIAHTGTWQLRIARTKGEGYAGGSTSTLLHSVHTHGSLGGGLNKRSSLPLYQIDKFQNSYIFSSNQI